MGDSGAALSIEVVNVERIDGYVNVVGALVEVLTEAEQEPGLWPRARCNAILADCRKRYVARMRTVKPTKLTDCDVGFDFLFEHLWDLISPAPHATHTELFCRVKKAWWVAIALERALSAMGVLDEMYPVGEDATQMGLQEPDDLSSPIEGSGRI